MRSEYPRIHSLCVLMLTANIYVLPHNRHSLRLFTSTKFNMTVALETSESRRDCLDVMEGEGNGESGDKAKSILVQIFACGDSEKEGELLEILKCSAESSTLMIKENLAEKWDQMTNEIILTYQGETLPETTALHQLTSDDTIAFVVLTSAPVSKTSKSETSPPSMGTGGSNEAEARLLFTLVQCGSEKREVLVRVHCCSIKKPFLGGYRHKVTDIEYCHASAQTDSIPCPLPQATFNCRDAQTVDTCNRCQQVCVDAATQMSKNGCFISNRADKMVAIRNIYETADRYDARKLKNVLLLQSHWRRWLAKRYVDELRRDKLKVLEWEKQEMLQKQRERVERANKEFHRRMNPHTREDFDLLYHALEVWRQEQLAYINSMIEGATRKAALYALMEQEADLIASIGRHKIDADRKSKDTVTVNFLNKMAAAHRWRSSDGMWTFMDTVNTQRAKYLRDIYSTLVAHHLTREERLDLLLTVKSTIKGHDCQLTRDLVLLLDREADLIIRGMKKDCLTGLQQRIATMFLQYCKNPLFNPEAAKHTKVPQEMSQCIHYCTSCCQYLPSTDFELTTNSRFVGHCRACSDLTNKAHVRENSTVYRTMLDNLQKKEQNMSVDSHFAFLLQEADLCHLIENIWGGQSALSASKELVDLTTVRWETHKHWSPWNCLVLTRDEAAGHLKLGDVTLAYGPHFVHKVQQRHILAHCYFSHVFEMAEELGPRIVPLLMTPPLKKDFTVPKGESSEQQQHTDQNKNDQNPNDQNLNDQNPNDLNQNDQNHNN